MIPFFYNVWKTWRTAPLVETDDPWGYGASLEWATSCPPPRHNFDSIPRIRSERPAFDLHHPESVGAGVMDAQWADGRSAVSVLGPADLGGNAFADREQGALTHAGHGAYRHHVGVFAFTMATIYGFWTSSTGSASSGSASSASSSAACSGS